jgi:hypothetical protein
VKSGSLLKGQSKSCGCLRDELAAERVVAMNSRHGLSHTRTHRAWAGMKDRCYRPSNPAYHRYGGRGIHVCWRWLYFDNFLADMGECPSPNHSIDRRDNDKGYNPDNCYWATWHEQQNNRSNNRRVTWNGETLTVMQWSRRTGINRRTIEQRLSKNLPLERVFTPVA